MSAHTDTLGVSGDALSPLQAGVTIASLKSELDRGGGPGGRLEAPAPATGEALADEPPPAGPTSIRSLLLCCPRPPLSATCPQHRLRSGLHPLTGRPARGVENWSRRSRCSVRPRLGKAGCSLKGEVPRLRAAACEAAGGVARPGVTHPRLPDAAGTAGRGLPEHTPPSGRAHGRVGAPAPARPRRRRSASGTPATRRRPRAAPPRSAGTAAAGSCRRPRCRRRVSWCPACGERPFSTRRVGRLRARDWRRGATRPLGGPRRGTHGPQDGQAPGAAPRRKGPRGGVGGPPARFGAPHGREQSSQGGC